MKSEDELIATIEFLMSQVSLLAEIAFAENSQDFLDHCDAYNAGKRVLNRKTRSDKGKHHRVAGVLQEDVDEAEN